MVLVIKNDNGGVIDTKTGVTCQKAIVHLLNLETDWYMAEYTEDGVTMYIYMEGNRSINITLE